MARLPGQSRAYFQCLTLMHIHIPLRHHRVLDSLSPLHLQVVLVVYYSLRHILSIWSLKGLLPICFIILELLTVWSLTAIVSTAASTQLGDAIPSLKRSSLGCMTILPSLFLYFTISNSFQPMLCNSLPPDNSHSRSLQCHSAFRLANCSSSDFSPNDTPLTG